MNESAGRALFYVFAEAKERESLPLVLWLKCVLASHTMLDTNGMNSLPHSTCLLRFKYKAHFCIYTCFAQSMYQSIKLYTHGVQAFRAAHAGSMLPVLCRSPSTEAFCASVGSGGPGCSSLAGGFLSELGPYYPTNQPGRLQRNEFAWTQAANVIFLESPAFVGWSYSNTSSDADVGAGVPAPKNNLAARLVTGHPRCKLSASFHKAEVCARGSHC